MNPNALQQLLRRIPTKWALALLSVMIVYALCQPIANSRLGWSLPSLASMFGQVDTQSNSNSTASAAPTLPDAKPDDASSGTRRDADLPATSPETSIAESQETSRGQATETVDRAAKPIDPAPVTRDRDRVKPPDPVRATKVAEKTNSNRAAPPSSSGAPNVAAPVSRADVGGVDTTKSPAAKNDLLYGILKDTGRDSYISNKGLRYTPGSEEGHRLKHLERHLQDMPTRPGKHGVFDGGMPEALKWIDEAFERGSRGARGTRKTQEDNRTVYEVTFDKPIGYIGGRDGARTSNPSSKRLRLVVEGNRFITAFPF